MKRTAIALSLLLCIHLNAKELQLPPVLKPDDKTAQTLPQGKFVRTGPTIQIAILLDTSNSMDGLINQAKEQIWNIVNEVSRANKDQKDVTLQVALYEYGKSSLPIYSGYMQMLSPLTNDLDFLSEKLFGLRTQGGEEYAGEAIGKASFDLFWSNHPDDLRIIIIAGNENFDQGHVDYRATTAKAREKGIIVNTIYCGDYNGGIGLNWQDGAMRGGGKYMNIDSDVRVVHIPTPYDDEILGLNQQLNDTYIGYGYEGMRKKERQAVEDTKNAAFSKGSYINRVVSKSTKQYKTESWDAVASYEEGNEKVLKELRESNEKYKDKSDDEVKKIVEEKSQKRKEITKDIQELEKKRREYIAKNPPKEQKTFGAKILEEITAQMKEKGYIFKK